MYVYMYVYNYMHTYSSSHKLPAFLAVGVAKSTSFKLLIYTYIRVHKRMGIHIPPTSFNPPVILVEAGAKSTNVNHLSLAGSK